MSVLVYAVDQPALKPHAMPDRFRHDIKRSWRGNLDADGIARANFVILLRGFVAHANSNGLYC